MAPVTPVPISGDITPPVTDALVQNKIRANALLSSIPTVTRGRTILI